MASDDEEKERFRRSQLPLDDPDFEPFVGWKRARQLLLHTAYHLWWIGKPPVESRDRTIYWLEWMNKQSVTELLKVAETVASSDRRILISHVVDFVDYLTKLDAEIVELRSKARMVLDKVTETEG